MRNLLPFMKKLPSKRVVKLDGLAADPLRFSLAYNASTAHGLPPGVSDPALGEWEARGIDDVVKRYNTSGQVRRVALAGSGMRGCWSGYKGLDRC